MDKSIGKFIEKHRKASGFRSQRQLAERTGISSATISRIEANVQKPNPDTLKVLAQYLHTTSLVELMVVCGYWDEDELLDPIESPTFVNINDFVSIPVLGSITAGEPIERIENIEGYINVEKFITRGRKPFALHVKGDSMIEDGIADGDLVIVVKQPEVFPNDIAVVAVNNEEATLKRVKCEGDMCMLIPSNPAMQPILVPAKDVHIIGKVVQARKNFE